MTLAELIQRGWAEHDSRTEEIATQLEAGLELIAPTDGKGAASLLALANHTIGDHGADRARALRLCEAVVEHLDESERRDSHMHLAIARHLAGDSQGALAAERVFGDDAENKLRVRLQVAQGLVHSGLWPAATELYRECLHVAESLKPGHAAERATAVVSNNIASALLESAQRGELESALMERAAQAARVFWMRIGTWVNAVRADYLLSRVASATGKPLEAQGFATRGLETIAANGEERVDEAFLQLALARACRDQGQRKEHAAALARARELGAAFEDEGLIGWFTRELAAAS